MDKSEAVKIVCEVLAEIQSISGRAPTEMSGSTCPIGDLADFDSLNGVEATVALSRRVGVDLPDINAFVNKEGTKPRTVSEIADCVCEITARKESSK